VVPLYFAKEREMIVSGNQIIPVASKPYLNRIDSVEKVMCRYRSLGCYPCSGAVRSSAATIEDIVNEMLEVRVSERATRVIDYDEEGSMELKKREGYF
jgi:sulfate adenylyltransferase subunit 2